jgi:hypothetical protein
MAEAMSEERLAELTCRANEVCDCGDSDCEGGAQLVLTSDEARELLDENDRLRATQPPLTDEYGMRITYVSTRSVEGAIADTLAGALEALAAFDAKGRDDVLSRKLRVREVGPWKDIEEGDDRG